MKKHYKHPVITVVKLDPEQALLVTCSVRGAYIGAGGGCLHYDASAATDCPVTVKSRLPRHGAGVSFSTNPS